MKQKKTEKKYELIQRKRYVDCEIFHRGGMYEHV